MRDLLRRRTAIIGEMSWWRWIVVGVGAQVLVTFMGPPSGVRYAIDFAEIVLLYAAPR